LRVRVCRAETGIVERIENQRSPVRAEIHSRLGMYACENRLDAILSIGTKLWMVFA
jgi:hypothetical protein